MTKGKIYARTKMRVKYEIHIHVKLTLTPTKGYPLTMNHKETWVALLNSQEDNKGNYPPQILSLGGGKELALEN